MPGYLKAFPKDDMQDQQDFARSLTKYGIHYHDFEQSFKKKKLIFIHVHLLPLILNIIIAGYFPWN
jgi:hypothetical protein